MHKEIVETVEELCAAICRHAEHARMLDMNLAAYTGWKLRVILVPLPLEDLPAIELESPPEIHPDLSVGSQSARIQVELPRDS